MTSRRPRRESGRAPAALPPTLAAALRALPPGGFVGPAVVRRAMGQPATRAGDARVLAALRALRKRSLVETRWVPFGGTHWGLTEAGVVRRSALPTEGSAARPPAHPHDLVMPAPRARGGDDGDF